MTIKQKTPQPGKAKRGGITHIKNYSGFSVSQDENLCFKLECFKDRISRNEDLKPKIPMEGNSWR